MKPAFPLFASLALTCLAANLAAVDWPQWRGPLRDGHITDTRFTLTALPSNPRILWRYDVGDGQSAPIVAGDKVIVLDERGGKEVAHVLERATGKLLWSQPYADAVNFSNTYGPGPRCTPLVDGNRLYVQSCNGEFRCLALADGKTLWRANFETDFGATFFGQNPHPEAGTTAARRHGNNGSPVIDGDRVFVPVGSPQGATLVAFDKKTGQVLWKTGEDNAAYAALVVATLAGTRQVVHFTADSLMGVAVDSGKMLWRVPVKSGAKRHILTPTIDGDTVTIASHTVGLIRYGITRQGAEFQAAEVWRNPGLRTNIASPVLVDGHLYGLGPGAKTDFICVDFKTGEQRWGQPGFGDYASIMAFRDKLLALNNTGEMFLLQADPTRYHEIDRLQVCGKTWSFPAFADGILFVRDGRQLIALELVK